MIKRIGQPSNNINESVGLILRGAKKRRAMALSNAHAINSDAGIQTRPFAVKG